MQYYTRQQLQGAGRYTSKCLIGNWNEEKTMEEHLANEYSYKKSLGGLLVDKHNSRLNAALQPVNLSFADENFLTIGDTIMLKHCVTG